MSTPASALDLAALWDYRQPAVSEQRFRDAMQAASGDDALILQTQIARTHGLRRDFVRARELLDGLRGVVATAGAEARVWHALEWGRTWVSAAHRPADLSDDAKVQARAAYASATEMARAARLDALAVDALHMQAFVDTAPAEQLRWLREALAVALVSQQPAARMWEASLRNNIGMALHGLGRFDEALGEFQLALAARERAADAESTRVARWMVAWTMRSLGRSDEALTIQLQLEREGDAVGQPDPYVLEELETLYRAKGMPERVAHYAARRRSLP